MTCLINLLLRSIQYYSIFNGFTFLYIDIERNIVKLSKFLKYYTISVNLIYAVVSIHFIFRKFYSILLNDKDDLIYFYILVYIIDIYLIVRLILLRLHEEKVLKKWLKAFSTSLTISQFNKQPKLSTDKTTKVFQILTIILIFMFGFYNVYMVILHLIQKNWYGILEDCIFHYFVIMEYYIMVHHSFILCYIGNCFSKLNNDIKNEPLRKPFGRIYFELSLILQEVNILYGPCIAAVLLSQIIQIALNVINMFDAIMFMNIVNKIIYVDLIIPCLITLQSINIFLYFKICDHIGCIARKTGSILMEYVDKENPEVYMHLNVKCSVFNFFYYSFTDGSNFMVTLNSSAICICLWIIFYRFEITLCFSYTDHSIIDNFHTINVFNTFKSI